MKKFGDRFYAEDTSGYVYKIVGDIHLNNFVTGYIRYFPDPSGSLLHEGRSYSRNNFVYDSFRLVPNIFKNVKYNNTYGTVVTGIPSKTIKRIFDPFEKVAEIYSNDAYAKRKPPRKALKLLLNLLATHTDINLNNIGVTASLLVGLDKLSSDIDLVVRGKKDSLKLNEFFYQSHYIRTYDNEHMDFLMQRRKAYLFDISKESLYKQERRKIQGEFMGIHVNAQPIRENKQLETSFYNNSVNICTLEPMKALVKIVSSKQSMYSPCVYEIKVLNILQSPSKFNAQIKKEIRFFISSLGLHSGIFHDGEEVEIYGELCKIDTNGFSSYGITINPWAVYKNHYAHLKV